MRGFVIFQKIVEGESKMTERKILDTINEIIFLAKGNAEKYIALAELTKLKSNLEDDIAVSEAKKNGNSNILKAVKSILKRVPNERQILNLVYKDDGYIVTNGYEILSYNGNLNINAVAELPETYPLAFIKSILDTFPKIQDDKTFAELQIPAKTELKNIISEQKAINKLNKLKDSPIYKITDDESVRVDINAEFLLNAIEAGITKFYNRGDLFYCHNEDMSVKYVICGHLRPTKK